MQRVTPMKRDRDGETPEGLLESWRCSLQDQDRAAGTVKKYTQAVAHLVNKAKS